MKQENSDCWMSNSDIWAVVRAFVCTIGVVGIIAGGIAYRLTSDHGRARFYHDRDRYSTAPTTEQRRKTIEDICPPDIYLHSPAPGYHDSGHIDCIPKNRDFNGHLPEKIVCDNSRGFWDCYENWLR